MSYRKYKLHLTIGKVVEFADKTDIPWEYTLMSRFVKANAEHVISVPNIFSAKIYIFPKEASCISPTRGKARMLKIWK